MRILALLLCCFICFFSAQAQSKKDKKKQEAEEKAAFDALPAETKKIIVQVESRLEADLENLPATNYAEIASIYKSRVSSIRESLVKGHFLTNQELNTYLQNIMNEVAKSNPEINVKDIRLLLARYDWANASCHGEGTIIFNVGLLTYMENESQIAFIICHELAHYVLNHVNKSIIERVEFINSEKTQKAVKKIQNSEYMRRKKLLEFFKGYVYDDRRHSRLYEAQADSMALAWLSKSAYNPAEALTALAVLDKVDQIREGDFDIKGVMNSSEFPFKDSWLNEEDLLKQKMSANKAWNPDSLKTHPDCEKRIANLKKMVEKAAPAAAGQKYVQGEEMFKKMMVLSNKEMIESEYFFNNYSKALYFSLLNMKKDPTEAYYPAQVSKCLSLMYEAQKKYELGKYTEFPSDKQEPNYKVLLSFIQNLRLNELGSLSYYVTKKYQAQFENNEEYLYSVLLSLKLNNKTAEISPLKAQYQKLYPNGKYKNEVSKM